MPYIYDLHNNFNNLNNNSEKLVSTPLYISSSTNLHHKIIEDSSYIVDGVRRYYISDYEVINTKEQSLCSFLFHKIGKDSFNKLTRIISNHADYLIQSYENNYSCPISDLEIKLNRQARTTINKLSHQCNKFNILMNFNSYQDSIKLLEYVYKFERNKPDSNFNKAVSGLLKIIDDAVTKGEIMSHPSERVNVPSFVRLSIYKHSFRCTIL